MKKSLFRAKFFLIKSKENNRKIKQNIVGLKSACHIVTCGCDKIRQINNKPFLLFTKIALPMNRKAKKLIK